MFFSLKQKAGNEAFKSGKYTEAIEHYTAAISSSVESRPFAAICFCNRAAAHQALGQIVDAIADCSLAIALDKNYTKVCLQTCTKQTFSFLFLTIFNDLMFHFFLKSNSKYIVKGKFIDLDGFTIC